ncbi:hypothetical protein ARMGADRAFT_1071202 [Armillaria gallica]|uniref:Uncharacterized protein n=1 Tax=Armillaria gallica TaxID=47427 RepID=A0A2H3EDK9_ARMGA|nr:hypothetical protein ARMGADRAFT_1071202 [Armillaria gallica]
MPKNAFNDQDVFTSSIKGVPQLFLQETLIPEDDTPMSPPETDEDPLTGPYIPVSIDNIPVSTDGSLGAPTKQHKTDRKALRKRKVDLIFGAEANNQEFLDSFIAAADDFSKNVKSSEAPSTVRAREYMEAAWGEFLERFWPDVPEEAHWHVGVIDKCATKFMYYLASALVNTTTPRRVDRKRIKARTLFAFMTLFIHLVIRYTVDPATSRRVGLVLLTKYRLHTRLKDQVLALIHHFELDRHYDKKLYFGRQEVQMMIDAAMLCKNMRLVKMNVILRVLFPFYMTSRPSSMGPFCKEYAKLGYYLKLSNLRIYRRSRLVWTIAINFRNYKGNNAFLGKEQTFYLESITRPHNLAFCIVTWMITYLYAIKAFKKKFPAIKPGGREFFEMVRAATSLAISASIGGLCKGTSLAVAAGYAIRRETGNKFGILHNDKLAKMIMAHEAESVFDNHYSKTTENVDVTAIMMGEVPGQKVLVERQAYLRCAVRAIIRQDEEGDSEGGRKSIMPLADKKAALSADSEMNDAQAAVDEQSELYYNCFTANARKYTEFSRIYRIATGEIQAGKRKEFTYADGYDVDNVLEIYDELQKRVAALRKLHKVKSRQLTTEYLRKRTRQDTEGPLPGTSEQVDAAVEKSNEVSSFLQPILKDTATKTGSGSITANTTTTKDATPTPGLVADSEDTNDDDDDIDGVPLGEFADPDYMTPMFSLMHALDTECPPTSAMDDDLNSNNVAPADRDINEEEEPNECLLSITEVRAGMMEALMQPIEADRQDAEHYDERTNTWTCPKCTLFKHDPVMKEGKTYKKINHFRRHMCRVHTEWKDLELEMVSHWTDDDEIRYREYNCPCTYYSHSTQDMVRKHMISIDCSNKDHHHKLLRMHNKIVLDRDENDDKEEPYLFTLPVPDTIPVTDESVDDFEELLVMVSDQFDEDAIIMLSEARDMARTHLANM